MSDPRSRHFGKMRHETLPPDHLFGRRLEMLTLAVMSQLRAKGNWHRIAREWIYGDAPVTELGAAEGEFYAGRGREPVGREGMTRRAAALRLVALAAALGAFVVVLALSGSLSAHRVRHWVDGYGAA